MSRASTLACRLRKSFVSSLARLTLLEGVLVELMLAVLLFVHQNAHTKSPSRSDAGLARCLIFACALPADARMPSIAATGQESIAEASLSFDIGLIHIYDEQQLACDMGDHDKQTCCMDERRARFCRPFAQPWVGACGWWRKRSAR